MTGFEDIKAVFTAYIEKACQLENERKIGDGLLGIGKKPADDPCHEQFAKDIERLVGDIASGSPASQDVREILCYMYAIPAQHEEPKSLYWMLIAVHGFTSELIPFLTPADAEELRKMYAKAFRPWQRLPVQKKVFDLLKKSAKA